LSDTHKSPADLGLKGNYHYKKRTNGKSINKVFDACETESLNDEVEYEDSDDYDKDDALEESFSAGAFEEADRPVHNDTYQKKFGEYDEHFVW